MFPVLYKDCTFAEGARSHEEQPSGFEYSWRWPTDEEEMERQLINQRNGYIVSDRTVRERREMKQRSDQLRWEIRRMQALNEAEAENNVLRRQLLEEQRKFYAKLEARRTNKTSSGLAKIVFWGSIVVCVVLSAYQRVTEAVPASKCSAVKTCKWNY